jgi:hypothetical protein
MTQPTTTTVTDRSKTHGRTTRHILCAVMCSMAMAGAADGGERAKSRGSAKAAGQSTRAAVNAGSAGTAVRARKAKRSYPSVEGRFSITVNQRLFEGYATALKRIQKVESCQGLFAEFGADGTKMLSTTTYSAPQDEIEEQYCGRATALTTVGGSETRLCFDFGELRVESAAVVLIHEALHHAGLEEAPGYDDALTAVEIDQLVVNRCNF